MKRSLLLFFACLFLQTTLTCGEQDDAFAQGNQAYQRGDFGKAIERYESVLHAGVHSADLYANLGKAYCRQQQFGKAIVQYERALLLSPNDAGLRADLDLAMQRAGLDAVDDSNSLFLIRWWEALRSMCSPDAWAGIALFLAWLSVFGLWFGWRGKDMAWATKFGKLHTFGKLSAFALAIALLLAFGLAWSSAKNALQSNMAIVTAKNITVYPAPDKNTEALDTLPEGTKVGYLDRIGEWSKVQLPMGEEGWVEMGGMERI